MLKIYNTATRQLETFTPLEDGKVKMYVCGLTVYNDMHLGHARTYVAFDAIRRWLIHSGYDVSFIQNHTDVDDKIIKKANEEGKSTDEISKYYIDRTTEDMINLEIMEPDEMPKATEFIDSMISLISGLIDKKHAYIVEPAEGSSHSDVYFHVPSASDIFGTLTGQNIEDMEAGARVALDSRKQHPSDFVLWKGAKPDEPSWSSPWGEGRPGWHIECSAMSMHYLGEQFDLHGGGSDLKFPHHESEILQSESFTGVSPTVKYWMHTGFLAVSKEKMSKSLDNFLLVRDMLNDHSPQVLRFFLLNAHYRSLIDFDFDLLSESSSAYNRLSTTFSDYKNVRDFGSSEPSALSDSISTCRSKFHKAMDDDFNTREAISALFDFARVVNKYEPSDLTEKSQRAVIDIFDDLGGKVLGLFSYKVQSLSDDEIGNYISKRNSARDAKDWATSDKIRDDLLDLGIELRDTPKGTRWRRL